MKCLTIVRIALACLGIVMIGLGAGLGWGAFPGIVEDQVEKNIDFNDKDSEGYKNFITPPVPVYMKFTFYELTNPTTYVTGAEKPKFIEKGPYAYKETREKRNLTFGEDNNLNFSQWRRFDFEESQSCVGCKATDEVTILNMPLIGAVDAALKEGSFLGGIALGVIAKAIENTPNSKDIALTDTVDNILFRGSNPPLVKALLSSGLFTNKMPPAIQDNGFAIFNYKNDTSHNENYQVFTNPTDIHSKIDMWGPELDELVEDLSEVKTCPSTINGVEYECGRSDPTWWPYPDGEGNVTHSQCNWIRGTDAYQFPPFLNKRKDEDLWIFTTDLCRSMKLKFNKEDDIDGIDIYRYIVPTDSGNINKKDNICFCKDFFDKHIPENVDCLKDPGPDSDVYDISNCTVTNCHDGLQNIENCQKSPVIMCSPHFYMAEKQLDNFESEFKKPSAENDQTYLDIEPITGMVLRAHKRIQVNMPIVPTGKSEVIFLENIKSMPAFPVVWLDEGADIDQENIDKIKELVTTPLLLLDIAKYGMIALGGFLTFLGAVMCC